MRVTFSQKELLSLLSYCPTTGVLRWKPRPRHLFNSDASHTRFNSTQAGEEAFTSECEGYKTGKIFGKQLKASRVIFCMLYGRFPNKVDHINGDRSDNRQVNLREVTSLENQQNRKLNTNNRSGCPGVSWKKANQKWIAQIRNDGKYVYLGMFDELQDAIDARKAAEKRYGYHQNHGR